MPVLSSLRWACLPVLLWVVSGTLQAADPPFIVTAATAAPNPVDAKMTRASVRADDDGGAANLTYTWTASGPSRVAFSPNRSNAAKDTTATFRAAGVYTLTATIKDKKNQTVTSTVAVTVAATPTTLGLSPATVEMNPATTRTFTATVRDQFAAKIAAPPALVWSRIGGTGTDGATTATYTAGTASGSITAAVTGTALTATSTITVNAAPTVAMPATAFAGPAALRQITLSALGADDAGEAKLAYTWSLLSSVPRSKATFSGAVQNTNAAKTITATVSGNATYTFRVRIRDAKGLYVYSQVTVVFPNRAPVVTPSPVLVTTAEDTAVAVTPSASDPDGNPLAWSLSAGPQHGTLGDVDAATGTVVYMPDPDANGDDSFALLVSDGVNQVPVPVTVAIAPVNDAPVAQALSVTGDEEALLTGRLEAADVDSSTLAWTATEVAHGALVLDAASGRFTYQPEADWFGDDGFAATVSDGELTSTVQVTLQVLPVNDAPVAQALTVMGAEDTSLAGQLAATDVDSPVLTWTATPVAHGTLVLDAATGSFTYQPAADWSGDDGFEATVSDGVLTSTAYITIQVQPVNDAPVAQALTVMGDEDTSLAGQLMATDVDSPVLIWTATPVAHGTLALDAATGSFTYQPEANWSGEDGFAATVSDGQLTSTVPVTLQVLPVNDAPVLAAIEAVPLWYRDGDAATVLSAAVTASDADSATLAGASVQITGNYQAGEDALSFTTQGGITGSWSAATGALTLSGTATTAAYQTALRAVRYSNSSAYPLTAARTISLTVSDGQATSAAVIRTLALVTRSTAPWSEDFSGHDVGADLHQREMQGATRWHAWDANAAASARVGAAPDPSRGNAVVITGASDLVFEYKGVSADGWRYTAWQYVPTAFTGQTYFILLNGYRDNGTKNWSTQVYFHGGTNKVHSDFDNAELPLIKDRWVELRVDIDLINDRQRFFYDGVQLYEKSWTAGTTGGGTKNLAAVDLFANNVGPVYYDDLSLVRLTPSLSGSEATLAYTENEPAKPITATTVVSGFGIAQLTGATVEISSGYQAGEDVLSFVDTGAITGNWNAGTLTLAGNATPADYQAALRSVTYVNTSEAPSATPRTLSLTVSNGSESNVAQIALNVLPVDDPAVITIPAQPAVGMRSDLAVAGIGVADIDTTGLELTASVGAGTISLPALAASGATLVSGSGEHDAILIIRGTAAELTAAFQGLIWSAPATVGATQLIVSGNGGSAAINLESLTIGPIIEVVPQAVTTWVVGPHISNLLPAPSWTWRIKVQSGGRYHLWVRGTAPGEWSIFANQTGVGAIQPMTYWSCWGGENLVQTLDLPEGEVDLTASGVEGGAFLGAMLVAETAGGVDHDLPVMASLGAITVLNASDFDTRHETTGHAWLPTAEGAIALLPDLGHQRSTPSSEARGVSYAVFFAQPGTYRLWVRGRGDGGGDSVWFGLDGAVPMTYVTGFAAPKLTWAGLINDGSVAEITVPTAGLHDLDMGWREDGVIVQQIAISGVPAWVPRQEAHPAAARNGISPTADDGTVWIEAESTTQRIPGDYGGLWQDLAEVPGAVGQTIQVPNVGWNISDPAALTPSPAATWYVKFTKVGVYDYDVWVRGAGSDYTNDSLHIGIAGDASTSSGVWVKGVGSTLPLTWSNTRLDNSAVRIVVPAPGIYPINLWMREDGAVLDRILIQPAGMSGPTDAGPDETVRISPVGGDG